jgi:hypothetical protein
MALLAEEIEECGADLADTGHAFGLLGRGLESGMEKTGRRGQARFHPGPAGKPLGPVPNGTGAAPDRRYWSDEVFLSVGGTTMVFFNQIRAGWTAYTHREALGTLDIGKRFQIGLNVLAGNHKSIDRTVAKWAKDTINQVADTVLKNGRPVMQDFDGFRRLLFLARGKLVSEGVKMNSATRLALFDAAWNETIGQRDTVTLFKARMSDDMPIDDVTLHKSFRNHIRHDKWQEVRQACDWISALQEANDYKVVNGEVLHNSTLIAFARKNFGLLWSHSFWEHKGVNVFYRSYFSVMLSMAALTNVKEKLQNQTKLTVHDIDIVQGSWRADPDAKKELISDKQSDRNIFRDMCWATALHYIECKDVNLNAIEREVLKKNVNEAHSANNVDESFEAMEKTFEQIFKAVSGFNKDQFLSAVSGGLKNYLESLAE